MSRIVHKLGLPLAFCAAMILTLPGCGGGPEEIWEPETLVEETQLEDTRFTENMTAGKLTLVGSKKVRTKEQPVERLTLLYEETWIEFDWDEFGLAFFAIVGGIVSIGLYFVLAFVVFDETDEDK